MDRNYDLSDPTEIDILKSDFEVYSSDEWQAMIDYSLETGNKRLLSYDERGCLMKARSKSSYNSYPSIKQMVWALKIADKVEEHKKQKREERMAAQQEEE